MAKFTKKQLIVIGILVAGFIISLILKASLDIDNVFYLLPSILLLFILVALYIPNLGNNKKIIGVLFLAFITSLIIDAYLHRDSALDLLESALFLIIPFVMFLTFKLGEKYGSKIAKFKKSILVANIGLLVSFTLYSVFSHSLYFIVSALLLVPIFFYPTRRFLHATSLFYFIAGFALFIVQGELHGSSLRVENLAFSFAFVTYSLMLTVTTTGVSKKIHKKPKRTKIKFYSLKEEKTGTLFIVSIWIMIEVLSGLSAAFNTEINFWFLVISGFCGIVFIPSIVWIYKGYCDIEADTEKIVLIKSGNKDEIKFRDCNLVKIKEPRDKSQWYKPSTLLLRGKKNVDIKLSNYRAEDAIVLKNMLYTYAGEKFRDKKVV